MLCVCVCVCCPGCVCAARAQLPLRSFQAEKEWLSLTATLSTPSAPGGSAVLFLPTTSTYGLQQRKQKQSQRHTHRDTHMPGTCLGSKMSSFLGSFAKGKCAPIKT